MALLCVTLWAFSSGSAPLIRIPLTAPTPVPTITAVGVASPREQGQAIASTVRAWNGSLMNNTCGLVCTHHSEGKLPGELFSSVALPLHHGDGKGRAISVADSHPCGQGEEAARHDCWHEEEREDAQGPEGGRGRRQEVSVSVRGSGYLKLNLSIPGGL